MYQNQIRANWKTVFILAISFLSILVIQDFTKEVYIFRKNINDFQVELNERIKEDVFNEVSFRVDEIETSIEETNDELEHHIIDDIEPLIFSIKQAFRLIEDEPAETKQGVLLNIVRQYNLSDHKHCYFVLSQDGNSLFDCLSNALNTVNVLDYKDNLNRYYYQTLLEESISQGDSYITYFIEENEQLSKYISYAVFDEDSGYVYGIQVTYDNYSEFTKNNLLDNYSSYYENTDKTVFIFSDAEEILYHTDEKLIGRDIETITSNSFYPGSIAVLNFIQDNTEGYIEYSLNDEDQTKQIAYVKYIEEWNIIIGSAVEKNSLDYLIDEYTSSNYNITVLIKIPFYIVLGFLTYGIYRMIKRNVTLTVDLTKEEENLYMKFADITSDSLVITTKTGIIQFVNKYGLNTIFHEYDFSSEQNLNEILVEEDGYYGIYSEHDLYYLKYNVEPIQYHGEECDLYVIQDVTEKVLTEKKLKELSLEDELTKLGNRRLMVKDFSEFIVPQVREGKIGHLVMLDLDNFKEANDIYGHRFGDEVLAKISMIFTDNLPEDTKIYRIGGDEFSILTLGLEIKDLVSSLYRINEMIQKYDFEKEVNISFSAGVAEIKVTDKKRRLSDYYELADEKLYQAKHEGKQIIKF